MQASNSRTTKRIYDIGAGGRLIAGLVFAIMLLAAIDLAARGWSELRGLPEYTMRHPVSGTVVLLGAALTLWCLWMGIWLPLRTFVWRTKSQGIFHSFQLVREADGGRALEIKLDGRLLRVKYNQVLEDALSSISTGEPITVFTGPRGTVATIERST